MKKLLDEIEALMSPAGWEPMPSPAEITAYTLKAGDWLIMVAKSDDIYDGAASSLSRGMVIRLTKELAEKGFKLASGKG